MFVYLSLFGVINVFIDTIKTHLREVREREREGGNYNTNEISSE